MAVYKADQENYFYIPNTFSPNGDGVNDELVLFFAPDVVLESILFGVFDRWGNRIFQSHEISNTWGGLSSNKQVSPGVYVYYLHAKITSCGKTFDIQRKGDITIILSQ